MESLWAEYIAPSIGVILMIGVPIGFLLLCIQACLKLQLNSAAKKYFMLPVIYILTGMVMNVLFSLIYAGLAFSVISWEWLPVYGIYGLYNFRFYLLFIFGACIVLFFRKRLDSLWKLASVLIVILLFGATILRVDPLSDLLSGHDTINWGMFRIIIIAYLEVALTLWLLLKTPVFKKFHAWVDEEDEVALYGNN